MKDADWCRSPIDCFILARLEAAGLNPAQAADHRTLIRRVTFDLTGLPPTPEDVENFCQSAIRNPQSALETLVDRLLASPHYGERWGRHWLDLVRYGETLGFEFDYDLYHAWRYRDYVIRALNADLPYDQFVIEHLAGDLLPQPRRDPAEGTNESILATGFFWMGEGKQSPVDIRQEQADRIDNQIDVLGKALLAQTIACARCHDHKFDAISTRDYYALAGYLKSSRYQQAFLDPPDRFAATAAQLTALKQTIRQHVAMQSDATWLPELSKASRYLLAARKIEPADPFPNLAPIAQEFEIDASRLERWVRALPLTDDPSHPLAAWRQRVVRHDAPVSVAPFEDFSQEDYAGWHAHGEAFGQAPARVGDFLLGPGPERPIARLVAGGAHSGLISARLQGELRSRSFTIEKPYIHYRLAGRDARVNLVIDGYTLIMSPMYGDLTLKPSEHPAWQTMSVARWIGHRAYVEISDSSLPMHGLNPPPSTARVPKRPGDGYIAVENIAFSESSQPPAAANRMNAAALARARGDNAEALAAAYQELMIEQAQQWLANPARQNRDAQDGVRLLNWLLECGLLDGEGPQSEVLANLFSQYRRLEESLPAPQRAPALADGTGEDECVFLRGNHQVLGERVPRRPPEVLCGDDAVHSEHGSGRLELARRLVAPGNPLLARVMVNRLWQHHFGEGLVRTPDDFGRMGQPPTHPELLDYLAREFMSRGWSFKQMHRLMLLSSTYRMASSADIPQSAIRNPHWKDPENRLLWRMPVRRLEAEVVRDAILAVSGRLENTLHGLSVLPYLTPHMEGRGRPNSGPLDGEGRRSIYLNARRNFLTPMFIAFDYPAVFTTVGRRGTTTVPTQALTLMNDPFVSAEARRWAESLLAGKETSTGERVDRLYQTAFARSPTAAELDSALEFLERQGSRCQAGLQDPQPWADFCHVLFNVKEFIFVP